MITLKGNRFIYRDSCSTLEVAEAFFAARKGRQDTWKASSGFQEVALRIVLFWQSADLCEVLKV